ncbi:hypothetical protein B0H10DRAFT_2083880 [Mycena sp. CBHHK59/15]|nr:hypothetical protein B0H10DRAFT_2109587 [Mycena sp. CBHHK59/15]KAJ6600061.1 hypothetical protein B0H10DRAFT_2083880 [Mycena sp. CBHHK59/15]
MHSLPVIRVTAWLLKLLMIRIVVGLIGLAWPVPLLNNGRVIIVLIWSCVMTRSSVAGIWWVVTVTAAINPLRCGFCGIIVCRVINLVASRWKSISVRHYDVLLFGLDRPAYLTFLCAGRRLL